MKIEDAIYILIIIQLKKLCKLFNEHYTKYYEYIICYIKTKKMKQT